MSYDQENNVQDISLGLEFQILISKWSTFHGCTITSTLVANENLPKNIYLTCMQ